MMSDTDKVALTAVGQSGQPITRRLWLRSVACASAGISTVSLSSSVKTAAQAPPLSDVIRSMAALTGGPVEENWVGPTASLVGIILGYSRGLRELDLGEIEPATDFLIR